ncbi:maestro heat-like repeat-containing protein family member 2B, partial [Apteryx mantelli]|uniref:Maestro heat-like repeat-containing protein family member 2B n=1 Tax=Apteryx mantelli TaxID=2696672 RepID=A0ABM4EK74_9AVES
MRRLRALREGLFSCGGCWSRPPVPEDGGRATESVPAAVPTLADRVTSLSNRLQDEEGDRAETYRELERVLQGDDGRLQSAVLSRVIAAASRDMRAAQGVTEDVRTAASDVLVALASSHFDDVMYELQRHMRALGEISEDFVFVTLGKLASSYALRCVPFVGMTLFALQTMLSQVGSRRTLRAVCGVLEQWAKAANTYLRHWEKCPFPRMGEAQFCSSVSPLFCHVVGSWLGCEEEEEVKQAVLGAMAAMMGLLLHEEKHRGRVARAVLCFTKELLSCSVQSCSAWDLVAHVFARFSQASVRLAQRNLSQAEAQEEADLQALCLDILHSLDVSVRGMTKLLWPRLLQYVVPAQYTGTLVPLSRCLRELAERRERAGHEDGEEEPGVVAFRERAKLPTPQALLARLLVVAAAPHAGGGCGVAALRLLQALCGEINGAVGTVWAVKIPFLLQYLEGESESCLDSAEWERLLLEFLRTSLETIKSQAWTMGLSFELSQQMGSYPRLSREQAFLYKAIGMSLAACQHVPYVRGELKKY